MMLETSIPYTNREISWLSFNGRVLDEAFRDKNPVLERLKFLGITASNLDEFFSVRVGGLKAQASSGYKNPDPAGLTPLEQLHILREQAHDFVERQYSCWNTSILPELIRQGLHILKPEALEEEQLDFIREHFENFIFPVLTPLAVDPARPFPFLQNWSLNIAVLLKENSEPRFAIVQVPSILPRIVELPCENDKCFVMLEDIIIHFLHLLIEVHEIKAHCVFRITRNTDLDIDEESEDLLREIQRSIKKRKRGKPVRMEISRDCETNLLEFLTSMLNVGKKDIYEIKGPLDLSAFTKWSSLKGYDHLRLTPIVPYTPSDFFGCNDIFEAIREKDRFVHHPYESFDCVTHFAEQAASDPDVLAIKQTLYRVSGNSPIIAALIKAAENGKQVTVLVELKARFDEENNIQWALKLEQAGCHVIYGLTGLKTHCKILLAVRREPEGIRRYIHMSTGNYNDTTARLYTDMGMFTARETFGSDASALFNHLTGYSQAPKYHKFVVAPNGVRPFFNKMIENEITAAQRGLPSGITIKVNSLLDEDIIKKLYEASNQGVRIRMIVRGICSLLPGLPKYSENIEVYSLVGQLLEHSRIFKFENGGQKKYYIGSADLMPRNLDRRVELLFPVEDETIQARLDEVLDLQFRDTLNARRLNSDGSYTLRSAGNNKKPLNSQLECSRLAQAALQRKKQGRQ